jgi:hypothetical protein
MGLGMFFADARRFGEAIVLPEPELAEDTAAAVGICSPELWRSPIMPEEARG